MKKLILIILMFSFSIFAKTTIEITSDENSYSLNDTINVMVKIVSDSPISIDEVPVSEHLKLVGTPLNSTIQSYQYINGVAKSNTTVTYQMNYLPLTTGTATVGPLKIKRRGKLFISNKLKLDINKPQDETKTATDDDFKYPFNPEIFIAARVDKAEPYVGEQVIVTYELYHRVDVDFAEQPTMPSFKNFWMEELDETNFRRRKKKIYKGYYFNVTPLTRMAIFPINPGEHILTPLKAKFKANIFSFGASPNKLYKRKSNLIKLNVKPLPEKNKPKHFPIGNIGDYTFTVSLSKNKVKVNEPFTINMKIKGSGNIKNLSIPKIENLKNFKLYEPTEETVITNKGKIRGSKSISMALKAEQPGTYKDFDLKFSFFNPKTKKYYNIDYSDLTLKVTGQATSPIAKSNKEDKKSIQGKNQETHGISVALKPIKERTELIKHSGYTFVYLLFITLVILLPFIYLLFYLSIRKKYKNIANKDMILLKNAHKKAILELKKLEKSQATTKVFYGDLHDIIITYIEEKFSIQAKGLTISQICLFLEEKGLTENYIQGLTDTLENSQYIRYSSIEVSDDDKKESLQLIRTILDHIHRGE